MMEFHYEWAKSKYPGPRSELVFTDTDSLCYRIRTADIYADMLASADMFDWSRPTKSLEKCLKDNQRVREKEKDEEDQRKEKKEEKEQEEEILPESPPMFAGRDVDREKLTKSYEQTELAWNEESKKRKLEEDMKPIVIDDDDIDEEKEKRGDAKSREEE